MPDLRHMVEQIVGAQASEAILKGLSALFPQEFGPPESRVSFHCIHCGGKLEGDPSESLQVCYHCYRANWVGVCSGCGEVVVQTGPGVYHCPRCGQKVRIRLQKPPEHAGLARELEDGDRWTRLIGAMTLLRSLYRLIGQMMSVDGWVTRDEMAQLARMFSELGVPLELIAPERAGSLGALDEGLNEPEAYRKVAAEVSEVVAAMPQFREFPHLMVELLTRIAFADGKLSDEEARFLWELKDLWGLDDDSFEEDVFTALRALGLAEPYRVLGIHPLANWSEIMAACHKAMMETDPTLLSQGGATPQMLREAASRREEVSRACKLLETVRKP